MEARSARSRPRDVCPYFRPFPDHFADCPAYEARQVANLDIRRQPVGRLWTCRHLETHTVASSPEPRWYAACDLGTGPARERYAQETGTERLTLINQLVHDLAPITMRYTQRLWQLKHEQVLTLEMRGDPSPVTQSMQVVAREFVHDVDAVLEARRPLLERVDYPQGLALDHLRELLDRVLSQLSPGEWDDRFDALMRFPEDGWSRVGAPAGAVSGMGPGR